MKKAELLNSDISRVVSLLGHTDALCISDAGLPIPNGVERIDLALRKGMPPFLATLETVVSEMCVEKVLLAEELRLQQPQFHAEVVLRIEALSKAQETEIEIVEISHEAFKQESSASKAIVRTGECTPYANIILYAGVTF